jgi:hypothetical protein
MVKQAMCMPDACQAHEAHACLRRPMHTSSGMEETTKKEEKLQGGVCPIEYQKNAKVKTSALNFAGLLRQAPMKDSAPMGVARSQSEMRGVKCAECNASSTTWPQSVAKMPQRLAALPFRAASPQSWLRPALPFFTLSLNCFQHVSFRVDGFQHHIETP